MLIPEKKFAHVHVDLVGPLPISAECHTHLLTVVDRSTRWPEVVPLKSTTAEVCADAFIAGWVFAPCIQSLLTGGHSLLQLCGAVSAEQLAPNMCFIIPKVMGWWSVFTDN